jgi:sugar O-acyltransferase (sialic acid O-acetyltransferase NeuD family)
MKKKLIVFGTSELAEILNFYIKKEDEYEVIAFSINKDFIKEDNFCEKPVVAFENIEKIFSPADFFMHVALSYQQFNKLRQQKYNEAKTKGYNLINYISKKTHIHYPTVSFGDNCFILENQTIQKGCCIGSNVVIWSGNHIGHETQIGDHVYISSHVVISGHSKIGKRSFLGVNSAVADFCEIGDDCFIGMGANISRNLKDNTTALDQGTKYYNDSNKAIVKIKKNFFF